MLNWPPFTGLGPCVFCKPPTCVRGNPVCDALKVEAEIRHYLAAADPDHPALGRLAGGGRGEPGISCCGLPTISRNDHDQYVSILIV